MKNLILLSVLFYSGVQFCFAQPGTPDPRFGINGIVKTDVGKPYALVNTVFKVLLADNGDLFIVAGSAGSVFINKRPLNGSLDSSYGKNGFSVVAGISGSDAIVQQDGKIIVIGSVLGDDISHPALVRYNTNGSLDNSFSGDGIEIDDSGSGDNRGHSVALQANGKIVVACDLGLIRYNVDGSRDSSFSGTGYDGISVPTSVYIEKMTR